MDSSKPNIIFLTFDSGRADHMGFLGYKKSTTPFLDSLAKKGTYFKNAFSTGPGSSVSFTGIFTSTYPLDYGGYSYIDKPRILLSEALKSSGYKTIGVHSSPYLSSYFGYDRGWDEFRYATYFGSKQSRFSSNTMSPGLRKGTVKSKVLKRSAIIYRWLKRYLPPLALVFKVTERILLFFRKVLKDIVEFKPAFYTADEMNQEIKKLIPSRPDEPLFLWAHYLDAHVPYALFSKKSRHLWLKIQFYLADSLSYLFGDSAFLNSLFIPLYINLYDKSLRFVDDHIRELLNYLDSIGINEKNSLFVFCADHGEAFLEHGGFGHSQMLFNVNINVPLLFYGPNYLSQFGAIEKPVSLIDVSPTILDFAGAKHPPSFKGKNLFSSEEREVVSQASECEGDLTGAVFTGITIIHEGYKLLYWKDKKFLFALDDRGELKNLYAEKKEIVKYLSSKLNNYKPKGFQSQLS